MAEGIASPHSAVVGPGLFYRELTILRDLEFDLHRKVIAGAVERSEVVVDPVDLDDVEDLWAGEDCFAVFHEA